MRQMEQSGRIDMDAYRGERSDDDEEDELGPGGIDDDEPRGAPCALERGVNRHRFALSYASHPSPFSPPKVRNGATPDAVGQTRCPLGSARSLFVQWPWR